jgi:putative hydrolase of the HAD superfamily
MIRGVIFDCFGVLYGGSYQALQALCAPDDLDELQDLNRQADYGFITSDEYIHSVAILVGKTDQEIGEIFRAKHVRNDELIAYVATLRRHCKVALLSNVSSGIIEQLFPEGELETLFDEIILSYEEHVVKPNPAVFHLTAERLKLRPEECVMVDDLPENCEGAEVAGMETIEHTTNERTIELLSKKLQAYT